MSIKEEKATFAGGCFWCMVEPFDKQPGIIKIVSGYTGGTVPNPTYEQVCSNKTGHYEAVQITYNPSKIQYEQLVDLFWRQIDPTDSSGQFFDRGSSYKTAIFYHNEYQKLIAEESKIAVENSGIFNEPIVTEILPASIFYEAEEEHQDYYKKNPQHYKAYKRGSGRESFIKKHWTSINRIENNTEQVLTPMQYFVTKENGTEPPFQNEYWDEFSDGIYVDIISGEPLFSSKDKFDAHCGWPSFTRPLQDEEITEHKDLSHGMIRTEVRSKTGNSHLGHVFPDGPLEHGGLRYCINSAALRFIKKEDLEKEGYGSYLKLFNDS